MYQNGERTRGRTPLGGDVIRRRTPNHVRTVPTHRRSGCNGDLTSNSDAERVGKSQAGVSILAAQIRLFFIHRYPPSGEGVPQDDVEAYKWKRLAATYADAWQREGYAENRDTAAELLTPGQRDEGQKRLREWFAAHPRE